MKYSEEGSKNQKMNARKTLSSVEKEKWLADKKAASDAAYADYRKAHPLPEIVEGSPYQRAREEWAKGGAQLDHWTGQKD
jgi:hypothetical protein